MSAFITNLVVEFLPTKDRSKRIRVKEPLKFVRTANNGNKWLWKAVITVPVGEYTDGHSIPWWLRWLLRPLNLIDIETAVLHDYLCRAIRMGIDIDCVCGFPVKMTREEADETYLEAMMSKDTKWWKRELKYFGCRMYTKWVYNGK